MILTRLLTRLGLRRRPESTTRLRASILAAFVVPTPTTPGDLMDRAIRVADVARWLCGRTRDDELTADEMDEIAEKAREVELECQAMKADDLLQQPVRLDMDHFRPPKGVYALTAQGAAKAMAVLKAAQEAKAR